MRGYPPLFSMNYGILTTAQQTDFNTYQSARVRKPTSSVLLSGIGDIADYAQNITFGRRIETGRGVLEPAVNTCLITAINDNETFYDGNGSKIPDGTQAKVWIGFNGLNVPVFTGVVTEIKPIFDRNLVEISVADYMWYFQNNRIAGFQSNDDVKSIIEGWAEEFYLTSGVSAFSDMEETLTAPAFDPMLMVTAIEQLVKGIFSVFFFDADGALQIYEREYANRVDFEFDDHNVKSISILEPADIINSVAIEYRNFFEVQYSDQGSIDTYRERARRYRLTHLNPIQISEYLYGYDEEELDNNLEGFKITSSATGVLMDTVHVRMHGESATGTYTLKLYSDSGGVPDALLGTSEVKYAADLYDSFVWEHIKFVPAVVIEPSTDYWLILDTSGVAGTIYAATNYGAATGKHAYYSGGWVAEDNKRISHRAYSCPQGNKVCEDMVRYFRFPRPRIRVYAVGVPQLELFDEVFVNVTVPFAVAGAYKVVERWIRFSPQIGLETVDTLESISP